MPITQLRRPASDPRTPHSPAGANPRPPQVIQVHDLVVSYGSTRAVDGIGFEVRAGEVFALLGTNGAGKTTTLDVLEGFRRPAEGSVSVLGADPYREHDRISPRIGVMLQDAGFFEDLSVRATIRAWRRFHRRARSVDDSLELVGLTHRARARVRQLSGGERRRLDLALALLGHPELLFLDEPTTGIDPEGRRHTLRIIRDLVAGGMTVVLTTHYLDEAQELADRLAIMHRGRIQVSGTVDQVLAQHCGSRVRCAIPAEVAEAPEVRAVLHARGAEVQRHAGELRVSFDTSDPQADLLPLLTTAARAGAQARDLTVERRTLEDVFLALAESQEQ
ncbi:ABC transporter ATP-binding protein [Flexivirga caeni]|uniref:ABC transporter ATP-binding protein n=1 Tax=Flexivirga caeni TaxID=2294115 RepID=A0A3M9M6E8_9MICO|nr:ABC transporter ATP-binding protein [Flexivirga caeni]RNI21122.1 ABC transporter ATP-binding protein [Flexivirga caeni]